MRSFLSTLAVAALLITSSNTTLRAEDCPSKSQKSIARTAVEAGSFKTLVAALQHAELVKTLDTAGPFTVFAPTDEAFAKLPKGTVETLLKPENKALLTSILTHHVVKGAVKAKEVLKLNAAETLNGQRVDVKVRDGKVFLDAARVVKTDISCSNGVIHVIDTVLMPSTDSIIATATKAGAFKTLAAALKAAHLVKVLEGKGPFTVFAPTDDAFKKLPEGTVASLLEPENIEKLQAILKYHVVSGRIYSPKALKAGKATTLQGDRVKIRLENGKVFVNNSRVVQADIDASNGVIHVIDSVLLPPTKATASAR